jgi:hypothetical protein
LAPDAPAPNGRAVVACAGKEGLAPKPPTVPVEDPNAGTAPKAGPEPYTGAGPNADEEGAVADPKAAAAAPNPRAGVFEPPKAGAALLGWAVPKACDELNEGPAPKAGADPKVDAGPKTGPEPKVGADGAPNDEDAAAPKAGADPLPNASVNELSLPRALSRLPYVRVEKLRLVQSFARSSSFRIGHESMLRYTSKQTADNTLGFVHWREGLIGKAICRIQI